jgi:phosphatidylglycerol:prolipoprotein diacylglycerol transferase
VADYIAVCVPFGMLFGRLANFVNGELWGRVAGPDVAWAMVFPDAGPLARHPSQLYEAALEGAGADRHHAAGCSGKPARAGGRACWSGCSPPESRWAASWSNSSANPTPSCRNSPMRVGLSMGQWLTLPLIALGLVFWVRALMRPALGSGTPVRRICPTSETATGEPARRRSSAG